MKKLALILLVTLAGCGESLDAMKERRKELREQVYTAKIELLMIDSVLNSQRFTSDETLAGMFTQEERDGGYLAMRDRRVELLAELEPKLEEVEKAIDREIRR